MQFPINRYDEHVKELGWMLHQVKLVAPALANVGPPNAETAAASSIHGSWKAFRSRMRLFSDGRGIETTTAHAPPVM